MKKHSSSLAGTVTMKFDAWMRHIRKDTKSIGRCHLLDNGKLLPDIEADRIPVPVILHRDLNRQSQESRSARPGATGSRPLIDQWFLGFPFRRKSIDYCLFSDRYTPRTRVTADTAINQWLALLLASG